MIAELHTLLNVFLGSMVITMKSCAGHPDTYASVGAHLHHELPLPKWVRE